MKVMIIGSGGREHALAWKIAQSPRLDRLYLAPGNAGTSAIGQNINIPAADMGSLLTFAQETGIDLTIVGPEAPLVDGLADRFRAVGLAVFGPGKEGAQLEGSKNFAKNFMHQYEIPTARFANFSQPEEAHEYIDTCPLPIVIKADGLAAGKGVIIALDRESAHDAINMIMVDAHFGEAGQVLVIEEYLEGEEVSILALTDGETLVPLITSQDHKRAYDHDVGPNTGGMGAYAPAPIVTPELMAKIDRKVLQPTLKGLRELQLDYRGIIYVGLMIVNNEPFVLEYNCRFGDPETQAILPLLDSDLLQIMHAVSGAGRLADYALQWKKQSAISVVLAAPGYPGSYEKGTPITGLDALKTMPEVQVFHAGTAIDPHTRGIITNGGRVLNVTGWANDLKQARHKVYNAIQAISFAGLWYRSDIGHRGLKIEQTTIKKKG